MSSTKSFASGKLLKKKGYSVRSIIGADPNYHDRQQVTLYMDAAVIKAAKSLFPGQLSMLCNIFLRQVIKKPPRIIMDMPFERENQVENPFQKPSMIVQLDKRYRKEIRKFDTLFDAHQATGANTSQILAICNKSGKAKTAAGYGWMYDDEVRTWEA